MQVENNSTKNTIINNLIISLSNVANKIQQFQQESLLKLDKIVLSYVSARNSINQKKVITTGDAEDHRNQEVQHLELLSLRGLEEIHFQSQEKVLQLENKLVEFYKNRDIIHEHNSRVIKSFSQISLYNPIVELCKEVMVELAKYKDIEQFYIRLVEQRKKIDHIQSHGDMVAEIQAYFKKMSSIIDDDEEMVGQSDNDGSSNSVSDTEQKQEQDYQRHASAITPTKDKSNGMDLKARKYKPNLLLDLID